MDNPVSMKTHALSWIDAWNRHDLEGILAHYSDEVVLQASTVARRWGKPDGILRGKAELRAHFQRGLELAPDLRFDFEGFFSSPNGSEVKANEPKRMVCLG